MTNTVANLSTEIETLSSTLLSTLDEGTFFGELSKFLKSHCNGDNIVLYKVNEDMTATLTAKNGMGVEAGEVLAKGYGPQGQVIRTKRAYFSNNVQRDPIFSKEAGYGVQQELCIPMICDGVVIGTVHVQSLSEGSEYSREDITAINSILDKVQGPLRNMKMYLAAKHLNQSLIKEIERKERELLEKKTNFQVADSYKVQDSTIVGVSDAMKTLVGTAHKVAESDISVLVQGDSGTGKEMISRRIHCRSSRAESAFITIDCTTLSPERLETTLFGEENGSFSGSFTEGAQIREGLLETANEGTLLINNIDAMPVQIQSRLVKFITEGTAFRVRGKIPYKSNVRIISATTKNIAEQVEKGVFREDLFYALGTVTLNTPSLNERVEDIEVLANYFLKLNRPAGQEKSFSPGAIKSLSTYNWPGNVRELQSVIERSFILSDGLIVERDHLSECITASERVQVEVIEEEVIEFTEMTLNDLEKHHICKTLDHLAGNKTKTAKTLGITVKTLYNKLHSYGMIAAKEA